jgi:hypothetical protein
MVMYLNGSMNDNKNTNSTGMEEVFYVVHAEEL